MVTSQCSNVANIAVDQDQSFTEGPLPWDAVNDWAVGHLKNMETIHD
jgi:hypothetical protein